MKWASDYLKLYDIKGYQIASATTNVKQISLLYI